MSKVNIINTNEKQLVLDDIERLRKELDLCNKQDSTMINSDRMLTISRALDEKINEFHRLEKTGG